MLPVNRVWKSAPAACAQREDLYSHPCRARCFHLCAVALCDSEAHRWKSERARMVRIHRRCDPTDKLFKRLLAFDAADDTAN